MSLKLFVSFSWHVLFQLTAIEKSTADIDDPPAMLLLQADISHRSSSNTLPSLDCVRVITMEGSSVFPMLRDELQYRGLWDRTIVQVETPDPEGSHAGVFRAHVRAWNAARASQCSHLLVLEDDAFFENATVQRGFDEAEAILQSQTSYDVFLLGWNKFMLKGDVRVEPVQENTCTFKISGDWGSSHAYIASRQFIDDFKDLEWKPLTSFDHDPLSDIDTAIASLSRGRHLTVRPMIAFQRYHKTSNAWGDDLQEAMQEVKSRPCDSRLMSEQPTFQKSHLGSRCAPKRCIPSDAPLRIATSLDEIDGAS